MENLVPLIRVINKSFPEGFMDVPVGLAAILIHNYELNLFFYFHTLLELSNNSFGFDMTLIISLGFDMTPIIFGGPCTVT